ncbi:GNAT family N-acetyltransferase [Amycolatopsis minnesotensis]|uniref:GNAT family N-acetyltransferase n=1 Tax=Amycolatopsis minnesotensis TaxID=337894 RepID=A0ABN2RH37_9PSEU
MVDLREVAEDDWERLREVRLTALGEAPEAFSSSYAREVDFTEADWRARLRTGPWFLALDNARAVGIASGLPRPDEWLLAAMWVAPAARGRGVGAALVDAVAAAAAEHGFPVLALQVQEDNTAARRLYERLGFTATGEWEATGRGRRERMIRITPVSTAG